MNNKINHNCKVCNHPMNRNMSNVRSRNIEGIANWLGLCSKDCMEKLDRKDLSNMMIEGRLSYLMDIQGELGRKPNEI